MNPSDLLLLLIAAHCYGDFLLQPNGIASNKHRSAVLIIHSGIHGLLAYLLLQQWTLWQVPLAVALLHGLIDRIKAAVKPTPETFAADQLAHLASLVLIAFTAVRWNWIDLHGFDPIGKNWIIAGAGFCAAVFGPGFFIGQVATRLLEKNDGLEEALQKGLKGGGAQIGRLERALIFLFLVIGHPAGIGFLIAAKSILRFEEAKQQNVSEYVLIGTFWSFSLALALSWLTLYVIH